jgi:hypothetical protein
LFILAAVRRHVVYYVKTQQNVCALYDSVAEVTKQLSGPHGGRHHTEETNTNNNNNNNNNTDTLNHVAHSD